METQLLFNIIVGCAGAFGGFLMKSILDSIAELRDADEAIHNRVTVLVSEIPATYVRRDDFVQHLNRIENTLARIEEKIDDKVDK